jgi:hypothetical protein
MRRFFVPLIIVLPLMGCAEDIRAGIDRITGKKEEPRKIVATEPRYCYRTIGKVNC